MSEIIQKKNGKNSTDEAEEWKCEAGGKLLFCCQVRQHRCNSSGVFIFLYQIRVNCYICPWSSLRVYGVGFSHHCDLSLWPIKFKEEWDLREQHCSREEPWKWGHRCFWCQRWCHFQMTPGWGCFKQIRGARCNVTPVRANQAPGNPARLYAMNGESRRCSVFR